MRLLLSVNQCALLRAFFFPASKSPSAGTGRRSRAWVIATQFLMMFFFVFGWKLESAQLVQTGRGASSGLAG